LTLDTGLLFPETYALMDEPEQRLHLRLIRIKPAIAVGQQVEQYGAALWDRQPDACCNLR
jgi:phosphoadenosine phosphosulfate reductase